RQRLAGQLGQPLGRQQFDRRGLPRRGGAGRGGRGEARPAFWRRRFDDEGAAGSRRERDRRGRNGCGGDRSGRECRGRRRGGIDDEGSLEVRGGGRRRRGQGFWNGLGLRQRLQLLDGLGHRRRDGGLVERGGAQPQFQLRLAHLQDFAHAQDAL